MKGKMDGIFNEFFYLCLVGAIQYLFSSPPTSLFSTKGLFFFFFFSQVLPLLFLFFIFS